MIKLLAKIFIKDNENVKNPDVRRAYGMLSSIVGIVLNIVLFAGKYLAGVISGSIAIQTDAFNNLSDAGSSFMTLIGFKFAGMKPDPDHPFGHGRIEYISGLGVSIVIILMGFELGKSSIDKIINPQAVETGMLSMIILISSILVKMYMAYYNKTIGKKIDSAAMNATATDSLSDSIATTVVLISMIINRIFNINIDGWCGMLVSAFILYAGYSAAKETLSPLLGQAASQDLVNDIEQIVMAHEKILGIHDLVVHDYGPGRLMISLHGEVSGEGDIFEIHDMIDRIEHELSQKLSCEAVIHMDPIEVNNELVSKTKSEIVDIIKNIDETLSIHDFRMVQGPTHTNLIFDVVVPFSFKMTDDEVKDKIIESIKKLQKNYIPIIKIDKSYVQHG